MMTGDEKIAQLHQVERANTSAADITKYGVGSVYSQGGSAPSDQHAHRVGRHDRRVPQGVVRQPPQDPGHLRPRRRSRRGPRQGRHRLPAQHRARRHARSGAGRGGGGRRRRRDGRRGRRLPVRAGGRGGARRALGPHLRSVRRDRRAGVGDGRRLHERLPEAQRRRSRCSANAKHYLGDGGTANGVNNGNTAGDETALRALHLTPVPGRRSAPASDRSWPRTAAGRGCACTPTRR